MSLNLNIDLYGGKSILPVICGSCRGTAFYIGNQRFLTAWHVVSEAVSLNEDIILTHDEETLFCRLIPLGEMDVALLECDSEFHEITPIELLKTDFRQDIDLEIIGYPQEIGNGLDYFGVKVKNLKELNDHSRDFDVMVLRTDPFGFHSYSGYSGSPVLNQKGVAIGVVTDQMYNTLGYTSIRSISEKLKEKHIPFLENADQYDMRDVGIGKCMELAEAACNKMKSRYTKENHVKDEELETQFEIFCGYETDRWAKQARKKLSEWCKSVGPTIGAAVNKLNSLKAYRDGEDVDNYDLAVDMEFLLNKRESDKSDNYFVTGVFRDKLLEISSLMDDAQNAEMLEGERFM